MRLRGNLDCEARWAGAALPDTVVRRISLYATLFAACVPDERDGERHEVIVPAPVDTTRLLAHRRWLPPLVRVERAAPEPAELAWADPAAKDANDRSRTLAIAQALGVALPGARTIGSLDELDGHLREVPGAWVCKARWTAAGRDRVHGLGPAEGELRVRLGRMLERLGPLVFEPWLDRLADFGTCGEITDAAITVRAPHRLRSDPRGGFLGIELGDVDPDVAARLQATARAAAERVAAAGYRGPFAVDAFLYRGAAGPALHPLCELNARWSFGWIAHALARRLAARQLGFDPAPAEATVLIAPAADRVTAWCA